MIKRRSYIKELFSLTILIVYLFSFSPSVIFHTHNDNPIHTHHEGLDCEHISDQVDLHSDCLHAEHIKAEKKKCFLCDYDAFYDHAILFNSTESQNRLFTDNNSQFYTRLYLKKKTKQSNKSPPILKLV